MEGWNNDKVTGLMRKTCVAETRAAGQASLLVAGVKVVKTGTMPKEPYKQPWTQ